MSNVKQIKGTECKGCEYEGADIIACLGCSRLEQQDLYKPVYTPITNLFPGAPVMVRDKDSYMYRGTWKRRYWAKEGYAYLGGGTNWIEKSDITNWDEVRLPTINEAPRNTWLAAPANNECPEGAEELAIVVWRKNRRFPDMHEGDGKNWVWEGVQKFMILEPNNE